MTSSDIKSIYISEERGSDVNGNGTTDRPFASLRYAFNQRSTREKYHVYLQRSGTQEFSQISESELTDVFSKLHLNTPRKCKISDAVNLIDETIQVNGWVSTIRKQGKKLMFFIMRDGSGLLQIVVCGELIASLEEVGPESTISVVGKIQKLPESKTAPGNIELCADSVSIIGLAPPGGMDSVINSESGVDTLLNQRHLHLRTPDMINITKIRSCALQSFRQHYSSRAFYEVSLPTIVQTQCEGGSTLFKFNFFGEVAYLTQSSQLYLETMLPSLGNVYCIAQSYRAELSKTRRHLAEYTHVEAELAFIDFDDLICSIEDLICGVMDRVMDSSVSDLVRQLNPSLKKFKRPFKRMLYTEALEYLKNNDIRKDDGSFYEFGDDIPEAPERKMTDQIGEPIFLIKFPASIKAFYMEKDPKDPRLTESVDLLLPGVGEVVGGSMRMSDEKELLDAYKKEGVDATPYYWYTDQRKYGTCEHGGYGLGFEIFLTFLANRHHIRDVCLYPRFVGRCTP